MRGENKSWWFVIMMLMSTIFSCKEKQKFGPSDKFINHFYPDTLVVMDSILGTEEILSNHHENIRTLRFTKQLKIRPERRMELKKAKFDSRTEIVVSDTVSFESVNFRHQLLIYPSQEHTNQKKVSFRLVDLDSTVGIAAWNENPIEFEFMQCYFSHKLLINDSGPYLSPVSIKHSVFRTAPIFTRAKFKSDLDFTKTNFECDTLEFNTTSFSKPPIFTGVWLPRVLFFFNCEQDNWDKPLDLRYTLIPSRFDEKKFDKCEFRIGFAGADKQSYIDGSKFLIPSDKFYLTFNNIPINLQINFVRQLIESCKTAGMYDSVEEWDILNQQLTNVHENPRMGFLKNFVNRWWWNFGYDQWYIIVWMGGFFCTFWLVTAINLGKIIETVYFDAELGKNFLKLDPDSENITNAKKAQIQNDMLKQIMDYRIAYSFFMTAVIFFGFKIRHEAVNYKNGGGMAYIYAIYLVGTFHVAYTIGYLLR